MPAVDSAHDEFLSVAVQALHAAEGPEVLDALGWWHLLDDLADPDSRTAVFALFRAQGQALASSSALGGLMAQPYLDRLGGTPGTVVAALGRASPRRGHVDVVVGEPAGRQLLVDRPGVGAAVVDPGEVELRPVDVPGRLACFEVVLDEAQLRRAGAGAVMSDADATAARARSLFLGRVAAALEILGAAEGALALAVEHARVREQFGQPIGTFQAVRHLLAWATTDCTAVERVAAEAVSLDTAAPPGYGDIAKAIAGRNGRRACERALQVMGGIGFTAEHHHHHFHSRVLALDALLGTSASLTRELGARRRQEAGSQQITSALLTAQPSR